MTASQWPPDGHSSLQNNSAPKERRVIVQLIGPDHPEHPINIAKRAAEAAQKAAQKEAEDAAQETVEDAAAPPDAEAPAEPERPKKRRKRRARRIPEPRVEREETPLERHERLCTVCSHEDCAEIEQEFLSWIHPESIAHYYKIEWRAIYRHAHAKDLFVARRRNLQFALGRMVELAAQVTPTIDGVLRAIRAFSSIDRNGRWTEIPTHVVVSSGGRLAQNKLLADSVKSLTLRSATEPTFEPTVEMAPESVENQDLPVLIDNQNE